MSAEVGAVPARPRASVPRRITQAVEDCTIVMGRDLRHFVRQPQLLIFSTVQPIMFVPLFAFVFGGGIGSSLPPASTTSTSCFPASSSRPPPFARRRPRWVWPRTSIGG